MRFILAALLLFIPIASSATAPERLKEALGKQTGTRLPVGPKSRQYTASEAAAITYRYAACASAGKEEKIAALLATVPQTRDEWAALSRMTTRESVCLDRAATRSVADAIQLSFTALTMRGPLAEILLKRVRTGRQRLDELKPPFVFKVAWELRADTAVRNALVTLDFAQCVRTAAPGVADQLLAASPGSAAEANAFAALKSPMSNCFPAGSSLKITKPILRGFVAEAAYRASFAPEVSR